MSIASEITRLQGAKSTLKTKLNAKNDEQHQITNETIDEYGDFVDSIEVIEPQTTEGESLSLTNTKAMPYSDYVVKGKSEQEGEPSPSNPSEIHSVADDVNLFDISSTSIRYGDISKEIVDNHLILTATGTTGAQLVENYVKNVDSSKSHTLSFKTKKIAKETDEGSKISIWVYGSNDDSTYTALVNIVEDNPVEGQEYSKSSTVSGYKYYRFYIYNNITTPVTVGEKTEYWDIKFQKGTEATPYSPYNQGTVTIKQRGKNLFDIENYSKSGYNVTIANPLKGLSTGDYTISCQNTADVGLAIIFSNEINGSMIGEYFTGFNFGKTLTNKTTSLTQEQLDANYLIMQGSNNSITEELLENMQIQIEQGTATSYEPYRANDYTFQTAPLRSLSNGVKDTIEADGIHRRVGKVVLDGSDTITTHSYGTNSYQVSGDINTNFKSDEIQIISNYFKGVSNDDRASSGNNIIYTTTNTTFVIRNTGFETVEQFTTWLSNNNTEVLYELEEEIIEPLTQNQATTMLDIIKTGSYEGTTNIYTDEDVKPTIGVGYYKKS